MALTIEKQAQQPNGSTGANGTQADTEFPTPYLGRSVRIVGPHVNVDMNQSPHPKNQRGEMGKPLFNWYRNSVSKDPLSRINSPNRGRDNKNVFQAHLRGLKKGVTNPEQIPVS